MFATEDGYVLALTYGPDTDLVKNVLAVGDCGSANASGIGAILLPALVYAW